MSLSSEQQVMVNNLKNYINNNFSSLTEFSNTTCIALPNISNILKGSRKFSKKLALRLEQVFNLESGYFTKSNEDIRVPFFKIDIEAGKLIFDNSYWTLENKAGLSANNLFALYSGVDTILIFNTSELELFDCKSYFVKCNNQFVLCKYYLADDCFHTDQPQLYSHIYSQKSVNIIARLIFKITIKSC